MIDMFQLNISSGRALVRSSSLPAVFLFEAVCLVVKALVGYHQTRHPAIHNRAVQYDEYYGTRPANDPLFDVWNATISLLPLHWTLWLGYNLEYLGHIKDGGVWKMVDYRSNTVRDHLESWMLLMEAAFWWWGQISVWKWRSYDDVTTFSARLISTLCHRFKSQRKCVTMSQF